MTEEQPPLPTRREADFNRFKTYAATTFLIAAPVLIALPPRKLDHLTVLLGGAFCVSANHIVREQTGRSIVDRIEGRFIRPSYSSSGGNGDGSGSKSLFGLGLNELPSERAQEVQARLRAARDARIREGGLSGEELERLRARQVQEKGVVERVWMGGEEEGWKERRLREEQKALDEGKGYGDLIREHIWDVWTWGGSRKEDTDGKEGKE